MRRELEICAESLQACHAAREGGADRIELCSALSEGGVTPSHGLMQMAIEESRRGGIPVHILLRPRGGNFVYTEAEFSVICADLEHALSLGAAGIVVGILTGDREVHMDRMEVLSHMANGRQVTFHRAFDHTADLNRALEDIIAVGCNRVLTRGGKPTVFEGAETLATLTQKAAGRIRVAAGGGVTLGTAKMLAKIPCLDFHASLRRGTAAVGATDPLWQNTRPSEICANDVRTLTSILHGGGEECHGC